MNSVNYIVSVAQELLRKHQTRDPYELCDHINIRVWRRDLGRNLKAFYFTQSRVRHIAINSRIESHTMQSVLIAHEIGHDQLHRNIAGSDTFNEYLMFNNNSPLEYEANLFAAELLISDKDFFTQYGCDKTIYDMAKELHVPAELLSFKFRLLEKKGHNVKIPLATNGDFLRQMTGEFS